MALAYDATRVTRDVDSLFVPHGVVLEEARNVAQDLGLPAWWPFRALTWLNAACGRAGSCGPAQFMLDSAADPRR